MDGLWFKPICRVKMRFLVIPCFNEEQRLDQSEVVECIEVLNCVVVLVDDGSTDGTLGILNTLALQSPKNIEVLPLPANVGKGEAVRAGFNYAFERDATQVLFCDADFAVGPQDLLRICNTLDENAGCKAVIGSRIAMVGTNIQRSIFRHYSGRAFATLVSVILGQQIYDTQCGAKVFKADNEVKRAFSQPFLSRWAFDVEIIGRLLRLERSKNNQNLILEMPLHNWLEVPGSKLNLVSQLRTVFELFKIRSSLNTWS
jgi:glycosyltransferase involved in cell wall biosynthesis